MNENGVFLNLQTLLRVGDGENITKWMTSLCEVRAEMDAMCLFITSEDGQGVDAVDRQYWLHRIKDWMDYTPSDDFTTQRSYLSARLMLLRLQKALSGEAPGFDHYKEIAREAITGLRLSGRHQMIQVCGPMTSGGFEDLERNRAEIAEAQGHLDRAGYSVFNQMSLDDEIERLKEKRLNDELVKADEYDKEINDLYDELIKTGPIKTYVFLPTYASSTGSLAEEQSAKRLGIKRKYLVHDWKDLYEKTGQIIFDR